ncbi:hypothetical protein MKW98_025158 [Papaver atlanticum]|uniref:Uncharacterized protein n=1 Tax=Papaver atlanticum TaxID=357466 RepID=A0AAD4X6I2_9MAGN|nr:hypothetical protein MKW98_025158 [Papaver atlanticum]
MFTPESCSESGEEANYENSYDGDTDSDSECLTLIEKFDSLFGDNSQAASSSATSLADSHLSEAQDMANKNMDDEATCRKKLDPYGEIWKKWALDLIMDHFFLINVAGYYGNAKDSGIGVLIHRQGIPIAACSYYEANNEERVSPFFQELRAVNKNLDMADKLDLKYIHIICTSTDVSYAITSCDRGAPLEDGNHRVHDLSLEIIDKLQKRRDKYQEEDSQEGNVPFHFYFSNFAGGKIDNIAARYLARLRENEVEMGPEKLSQHEGLMDMIFKDATGLSDVILYCGGD